MNRGRRCARALRPNLAVPVVHFFDFLHQVVAVCSLRKSPLTNPGSWPRGREAPHGALCHAGVARAHRGRVRARSRSRPCAVEVTRDDDANAPRLTGRRNAVVIMAPSEGESDAKRRRRPSRPRPSRLSRRRRALRRARRASRPCQPPTRGTTTPRRTRRRRATPCTPRARSNERQRQGRRRCARRRGRG